MSLSSLLREPEKLVFEPLTAFINLLATVILAPARSLGGNGWWVIQSSSKLLRVKNAGIQAGAVPSGGQSDAVLECFFSGLVEEFQIVGAWIKGS